MKWFQGSIDEAVTTYKAKKAIFVVYVEGKDEASGSLSQIIDSGEISNQLEQEHFVAIKLESDSVAYTFFAQIYHVVPVPSIFFIGENGMPLKIVVGNVTVNSLSSDIHSILEKAGKLAQESSMNFIQAEQQSSESINVLTNKAQQNLNTLPTSSNESDGKNVNVSNEKHLHSEIVLDAGPKEEMPKTSSMDDEETNLTTEDKIERAKLLIELQKKQRIEEEKRKEKERELERRRIGRDVQKMRQQQQDLEIKQAHEDRLREKAAEAAAREKVRQQIAQDKLERKQKELAYQQKFVQQQKDVSKPQMSTSDVQSNTARIQFRLPSGTTHTAQFESTTSLASLRNYVVENIQLPFQRFTMYTSYPRKDLTTEDAGKTLIELELVPTSVILILPQRSNMPSSAVTRAQDGNFFSRILWTLFTPIFSVYNYMAGLLFGAPRRPADTASDDNNERSNSEERIPPYIRNIAQSGERLSRNINIQGSRAIRAQGNIHRLHSERDDNDENNTWNGNSTQQM